LANVSATYYGLPMTSDVPAGAFAPIHFINDANITDIRTVGGGSPSVLSGDSEQTPKYSLYIIDRYEAVSHIVSVRQPALWLC
jgi:hypothetical protein